MSDPCPVCNNGLATYFSKLVKGRICAWCAADETTALEDTLVKMHQGRDSLATWMEAVIATLNDHEARVQAAEAQNTMLTTQVQALLAANKEAP